MNVLFNAKHFNNATVLHPKRAIAGGSWVYACEWTANKAVELLLLWEHGKSFNYLAPLPGMALTSHSSQWLHSHQHLQRQVKSQVSLTWLLVSECISTSDLLTQLSSAVRTSLVVVKQLWVIKKTSTKSSRNLRGLVSCWKSFSRDAAAICRERNKETNLGSLEPITEQLILQTLYGWNLKNSTAVASRHA